MMTVLEVIYNQVKNSGCSEREFKELSLQDFIISGSITAHCYLKHLSLVLYYYVQMTHYMQKWDYCNN